MENTNLLPGATLYEIAPNLKGDQTFISEMKILCVGEKSVFVSGKCAMMGYDIEITYAKNSINTIDPSRVFDGLYYKVIADSREKAEELKAECQRILDFKNKFKKQVAS